MIFDQSLFRREITYITLLFFCHKRAKLPPEKEDYLISAQHACGCISGMGAAFVGSGALARAFHFDKLIKEGHG